MLTATKLPKNIRTRSPSHFEPPGVCIKNARNVPERGALKSRFSDFPCNQFGILPDLQCNQKVTKNLDKFTKGFTILY